MHDHCARSRPHPVVRDPALRFYRRRYFVQTQHVAGRTFSTRGASRIASRTRATWRATLTQKWDLAVEREQAHRRAVGI